SVLNDTSTTINSSGLSEGSHSWTVNCSDNASNIGASSARTLYVDNTAPVVNVNVSLNNTVTGDSTPLVGFNFTDSLSNESNCTLFFNDSVYNITNNVQNGSWTDMTANDTVPDGRYDVYINCTDRASNTDKSGVLNISVDTKAPAITSVITSNIIRGVIWMVVDNQTPVVNVNVSLNNTVTSDSTPTVDFNFTDTLSPTDSCQLFFNDTVYDINASVINNSQTDMTANDTVPNGRYDVYINCTDSASNVGKSGVLNITVNVSNVAPIIDNVSNISNQDPNPEAIKMVEVNFTASDPDGVSDLNDSTAKAVFSKGGVTREGNCTPNDIDENTTEYNCSVGMQYYDSAGTWAINVSVMDNASLSAYNDTTNFSYNELLYIQVSPTVFGFGDYYLGDTDKNASSNPLLIDNMGNVNLTIINITAYNLVNGSYTLGVSNVTVNVSDAVGTALQHSTELTIPYANVNVDVGGVDANESLYFYITIPNIPPLNYVSSSSWVIKASD
nr:hypothetical protein [Nanoarchaeota archaeon]